MQWKSLLLSTPLLTATTSVGFWKEPIKDGFLQTEVFIILLLSRRKFQMLSLSIARTDHLDYFHWAGASGKCFNAILFTRSAVTNAYEVCWRFEDCISFRCFFYLKVFNTVISSLKLSYAVYAQYDWSKSMLTNIPDRYLS